MEKSLLFLIQKVKNEREIVEFFDKSDYSNLRVDSKGNVVDLDSNNIVGVDYKGNAINEDIPFADIGFIKENFKIEK